MRILALFLLVAAGCHHSSNSPTLPTSYNPIDIKGSKINVISDGSHYGFRIIEVTHNDKTHFFLWNYDGNNQSMTKFDELELK